ncbi:MAG: DUF58 domain-containing protein [Lachnospiraceae bacterium]|nr:DUF58 domain-containing protein [Lachnospiraceae bacterium]
MAANRIILILLWILSLIGISFYGGPVTYVFFAVMTMIPLISLLYILIVYFRFKIYQDMNKNNVVADSISDFYITLQNEDFLTFSGIRIMFYSPFSSVLGIDERTEYELGPFSGIKKETSLLCRYRGEYEVGIKSIVIQDFFRIFKLTYRNREPFRISVLPQIIEFTSLKTLDIKDTSSVETTANATEPDILVRDYVPGDSMRMIHWPSSASTGKLLVRKMTGEENSGLGMIIDPSRYSEDPSYYLPLENKISEIAIALAMYFVRNNTPVSIYSFSGRLIENTVKDTEGFKSFYSFISHFIFEKDNTQEKLFLHLAERQSVFSDKLVIMILHTLSPEANRTVDLLKRNGVLVVIYLVTDDDKEAESARILCEGDLFVIPTQADLREVL